MALLCSLWVDFFQNSTLHLATPSLLEPRMSQVFVAFHLPDLIFCSFSLAADWPFPLPPWLNWGVFMYLLPSRHPTPTTPTTLTVPRRSTLPLARLKTCGLLTLFCHFSFWGLDAPLSAVALSREMHSKFQRVKRGDPVLGPHSPGSQFTVLFQVLGLSQSWLLCESLGPFCSCLTPTPLQYDLEK